MKSTIFALFLAFLVFGLGTSPALSLELENGGFTMDDQDPMFGNAEVFDDVGDLEDALNAPIDEAEDAPEKFRKIDLIGIWQYTGKHEGWFAGKLCVKVGQRRILLGRVKGIFKKSLLGVHEMVGLILDREGKVRGKIKGIYGKRGFRARWTVDGGEKTGKAKARFIAPYGRAGFVGYAFAPKGAFDDKSEE